MSEKIRLWKLWKVGGSEDKDLDAKWKAQRAVYTAERNAEIEHVTSVKDNKENIFRVARQMRTKNQDIIRQKFIRGDDGNISLDNTLKS